MARWQAAACVVNSDSVTVAAATAMSSRLMNSHCSLMTLRSVQLWIHEETWHSMNSENILIDAVLPRSGLHFSCDLTGDDCCQLVLKWSRSRPRRKIATITAFLPPNHSSSFLPSCLRSQIQLDFRVLSIYVVDGRAFDEFLTLEAVSWTRMNDLNN